MTGQSVATDLDPQLRRLERRAARERVARKSAETLLENKSRELYNVNQALETARQGLEDIIEMRTSILKRHADFTQTLFRATANTSLPISVQLYNALEIATEALGLSSGTVSEFSAGRHYLRHLYNSPGFEAWSAKLPPLNQPFKLSNTMNSFLMGTVTVFAVEQVSQSALHGVRDLSRLGVETFLGTEILVHGEVYGTLVFASPEPYKIRFDDAAKNFVTLMARWVGSALERQSAEIVLQNRQDELRKLSYVASGTDNIVVITDEKGVIEWVNVSFENLTGYTFDEVIGQRPGALLQGPDTDPDTITYIRSCLKAQRGFQCEMVNYTKSGTPYWMDIEVRPVYNNAGELVNYIAIERDITHQRENDAALRQAKQDAEEANVAKSQFLANMSHEIRTPMNAILGMAGLLSDTSLSAEQAEFASIIRVAGENLLTIINEILDFSKIEAGKMELEDVSFNLRSCIEESLDLLSTRAADKKLDLAYFIENDTPANIISDVTRLRQVLVNLINNAIKFTESGEVVVTVKPEKFDGERWRLHFAVRDSGIGIPAERIDKLFQAFTQVDASTTRKHGGTGLGLAISKRICEMMGGSISVESEQGVGSIFKFDIVVRATDDAKAPMFPQSFDLTNRHMLIVDDNATNRFILRRYAESWGMRHSEVDSAKAALALLAESQQFDVAVLDVQMPEMDGIELALQMKQDARMRHIPIIILSSTGQSELMPHSVDIISYLHKPLKPSQLLDALAAIFAGIDSAPTSPPEKVLSEFDSHFAARYPLQILLAEDNRINQLVATRMLSRLGYRVDVAGNGIEALEALERQSYDVVLMDIQMPEMDGVEATQIINSRYSAENKPTIVALTANALQGDRERYLSLGMDFYLSKPIRVKELTTTLALIPAKGDAQPDESSIDLEVAKEQFGDDTDSMMEILVPMFVEDSGVQMKELQQALGADDLGSVRRLAHTLKGSSASLGATRLASAASALEVAGKQENSAEVQIAYTKLQNAYQDVLSDTVFQQWL